jgi:hypothetical protein
VPTNNATRVRRVTFLTGIGVALTCALTACGPTVHLYAKQEGGEVVFLSCEPDFEANQIMVSFFANSASDVTAWQVDGSELVIAEGSEYRAGQPVPGLTTTIPYSMTVDELNGGAFEIAFNLVDEDGTILRNKVASFDGSKLSESAWIDRNGVAVDEPC